MFNFKKAQKINAIVGFVGLLSASSLQRYDS
jgi:hypothetical protein